MCGKRSDQPQWPVPIGLLMANMCWLATYCLASLLPQTALSMEQLDGNVRQTAVNAALEEWACLSGCLEGEIAPGQVDELRRQLMTLVHRAHLMCRMMVSVIRASDLLLPSALAPAYQQQGDFLAVLRDIFQRLAPGLLTRVRVGGRNTGHELTQ
jgi:hypothetical protein